MEKYGSRLSNYSKSMLRYDVDIIFNWIWWFYSKTPLVMEMKQKVIRGLNVAN